jgi:hypothetical protein
LIITQGSHYAQNPGLKLANTFGVISKLHNDPFS